MGLGLSLIGLIASIISLLFKALVILFDNFEFAIQLVAWVNSLDSLINFTVLFFQYGFAARHYYYWFGCINRRLTKCMERRAQDVVLSQHEYVQTDADDSAEEDSSQR